MKDYSVNIFYSEEDGGVVADVPDLQVCSAFGDTPAPAAQVPAYQLSGRLVMSFEDGGFSKVFHEDARDLLTLRQAKADDDGTRVPLSNVEARLRHELGEGWDAGLDDK